MAPRSLHRGRRVPPLSHRDGLAELGILFVKSAAAISELRTMVSQMEREIEHVPNVQVRYSDALAKVDLSGVEVIHAIDGWHPSVEGHNVFAEAAYRALAPSLEFLGISRAAAAAY